MVLLAQAELIPANLRLSPLISGRDIAFVSDLNLFLRQMGQKELSRVVSLDSLRSTSPVMQIPSQNRSWAWFTYFFRMSGQPMYGIMEGIQYSLDKTVDHLNTLEAEELSRVCAGLPDQAAIGLLQRLNSPVVLSLKEISDPRVEHLASFDALAAQRVNVYRLHESLPRAYFVNGVEQASSHADAMRRFLRSDFAYDRNVILENGPPVEMQGRTTAGKASVVNYANNHVVSEVKAQVPGYLVLLDSYYPGWRAYVDGVEVRILRANYAFRAVQVGAGNHRVEFIYRPRSFYLGLWVSSVALFSGVVSLFWCPRHKVSGR